uniref:Uncharacterized protein n=1 Tax=Ciona intestinalis TaxID=7719 RepID=F7BCZ5_CIOIN
KRHSWIFYTWRSKFIAEFKEPDFLLPRIRIEFNADAAVSSLALCGWTVPTTKFSIGNGQYDTLCSLLREAEKLILCCGIKEADEKSKIHPYLKWNEKKIVTTNIIRSPNCNIIVDQHCNEVPVCQGCLNYSGF